MLEGVGDVPEGQFPGFSDRRPAGSEWFVAKRESSKWSGLPTGLVAQSTNRRLGKGARSRSLARNNRTSPVTFWREISQS